MIDTVVLNIDLVNAKIKKESYSEWSPDLSNLLIPPYMKFGNSKCINSRLDINIEKEFKGAYMPRISLNKAIRKNDIVTYLRIEFSIPKIIYDNNFDEVEDNQFEAVCISLQRKLLDLGVFVGIDAIQKAKVKTIHYSKNIIFTDYVSISNILNSFSKANVSKRRNSETKSYKNNGEAVYYYNNNKGIILYDKVKELNKNKNRKKGTIELDHYCQKDLFDKYDFKKPFQVLRIESRYRNKEIKNLLKKLDYSRKEPIFKDLFDSKLSKTVLRREVDELIDKIPPITNSIDKYQEISDLLAFNGDLKFAKKLKILGFKMLIDDFGYRSTRELLCATPNQWYEINKDFDNLRSIWIEYDWAKEIKRQLNDFKAEKIIDYIE